MKTKTAFIMPLFVYLDCSVEVDCSCVVVCYLEFGVIFNYLMNAIYLL